jgi:uncharacterized protein involved in outer membrane biogenesis
VVALAAVALAGIVLVLALGAGILRAPLVAFAQVHFDRPIHVGAMQLQLWSRHPRLVAQQVTIGNPPWVAAGEMARIEHLTLVFGAPGSGGAALAGIAMQGATLHLLRDATGHANWQRFNPDSGRMGTGAPPIRDLSGADVHLLLDDQLQHLQFDGTVTAHTSRPTAGSSRLHVQGEGRLNGRPAIVELSGDPLESVRADVPYAFDFSEQSSGSRLELHGSLPQPFDFSVMDGTLEAAGPDLADLRYLTGMRLVHSGAYRLSGAIARRGNVTHVEQLKLSTGQSEVASSISIQQQPGGRRLLQGTVTAGVLRLADFGARAAGRPTDVAASGVPTSGVSTPGTRAPPRLFSDVALNVDGLRRVDAQLRFEATRVLLGRTPLQALSGQLKIDHGVVIITALRGELMQGNFEARLKLDASQPVPVADVSMRFNDLQLASLGHGSAEPPLSGLMQVRIDMTGHGASLHQVAASADGSVSISLPHGAIRASLAELAGVDLRGLGLAVTHSKRETAVRCAAATFEARDGTLTAQSIVIDTEPVIIRGEGTIRLDTESLDIWLRGEPKHFRLLRVDAPLLVGGTLSQPSVGIQTHDSSVKLVDPGHGKSVQCASLLSHPD